MVIWLIGLSGSGKSTLGKALTSELRGLGRRVAYIDGDVIREVFGGDLGHTVKDRLINAKRISSLSKFLSEQQIDVVAAVLSIFPEWQQWNRDNIEDYFDVYIKSSLETLVKRDGKGLYKKALSGEIENVVGIDIKFPEPFKSKLIIENNKSIETFLENTKTIIDLINNK